MSKNAVVKMLVEKKVTINQLSNEVKNVTNQEFQKIKPKHKSINCNRNHVPKVTGCINRYIQLFNSKKGEKEDKKTFTSRNKQQI